jgi:hypothetical protein
MLKVDTVIMSKEIKEKLGMVVHTCNPILQEAEAIES